MMTIKNGCAICSKDVRGNRKIKYLCSKCNILFDFNMIGLYIGRFQPFHNGHLKLIKDSIKSLNLEKIIIVVAIPLRKTERDPFSADDRIEMIKRALEEENINNFYLTKLKDIPSDDEYVNHVRENVPPFNVVIVGESKLNEKLFKKAGFKVITSERLLGISSTMIRELMRKNNEKWKDYVPKAVADYIKKKGLIKELDKLNK
ncbi:MAG: adenylyltransferase/cytidyltransferase family protein [Candidatus Woesearchaeota archaeon]|nr:adenylyltransferase/cytidyltransferase family protein [Candidatus Woesearchaeota archaeon]